jgi:hypothetical protein
VSQIVSSGQTSSYSSNKKAADKEFNVHHGIIPTESLEMDGLLIRYSMLAIPHKTGFLLRLSLVFRNLQDHNMIIRPKILLLDASGKKIKAYSKNEFLKMSSRLSEQASEIVTKSIIESGSNERISAKSRIEWANTYWLKSRYKISSQGIAIGELVFHGAHLNLPIKLTVKSNRRKFIFTTHDSLQILGK